MGPNGPLGPYGPMRGPMPPMGGPPGGPPGGPGGPGGRPPWPPTSGMSPVYGGGPLPRAIFSRQTGTKFGGTTVLGVGQAIDELAENKLIDRDFSVKQCTLGQTRSCFLMVFSPDRSLMASTHGDHNIYVTAVKSGACVQTLKGHPR